jgi:hypothetical protein
VETVIDWGHQSVCQWSVKCSHESWMYKWSINRVTNANPVYSHSILRDNIISHLRQGTASGLFPCVFPTKTLNYLLKTKRNTPQTLLAPLFLDTTAVFSGWGQCSNLRCEGTASGNSELGKMEKVSSEVPTTVDSTLKIIHFLFALWYSLRMPYATMDGLPSVTQTVKYCDMQTHCQVTAV